MAIWTLHYWHREVLVICVEMARLSADMNPATIMPNAIIQDAEPSRRAEIVMRGVAKPIGIIRPYS